VEGNLSRKKVKSVVLEKSKQMPFYTDLKRVFEALGGRQKEFNWLITNLEYSANLYFSPQNEVLNPSELPDYQLNKNLLDIINHEVVWISGEKLSEIVDSTNIQFIWAVLSGFRKEVTIDIQNLTVEPYADGNPDFWIANPTIQHPMATVEIVCWDSTLTLLLSNDDDLVKRFITYFSDSIDLIEHNKKYLNSD